MNPSGHGAFCFGKLLIINSDSIIVLFRLSVSSYVNLARLCLSKHWSFSSSYQIFKHRVVHSILYSSHVHRIYSDVSSFISDISNLYPFSSFLLAILARGLLILLIFSKNQFLFCFHFPYSFLLFNFIDFWLIYYFSSTYLA